MTCGSGQQDFLVQGNNTGTLQLWWLDAYVSDAPTTPTLDDMSPPRSMRTRTGPSESSDSHSIKSTLDDLVERIQPSVSVPGMLF